MYSHSKGYSFFARFSPLILNRVFIRFLYLPGTCYRTPAIFIKQYIRNMEHITDFPECSTILTFIHVTCESIVECNKKLKSEHETWYKFYYLCNLSFTVKFLITPCTSVMFA
jgi:hypothetical protein